MYSDIILLWSEEQEAQTEKEKKMRTINLVRADGYGTCFIKFDGEVEAHQIGFMNDFLDGNVVEILNEKGNEISIHGEKFAVTFDREFGSGDFGTAYSEAN